VKVVRAAWLFVIAHTDSFFVAPKLAWLEYACRVCANLGMMTFFVLSGFVIHYNYGASIVAKGAPAIRSFLIARFARLYPLYLLALLIGIALSPSILHEKAFSHWCWRYLTMSQDWTPTLIDNRLIATLYLGSAWSISAEVGLYLFYLVAAASLDGMRTVRTAVRDRRTIDRRNNLHGRLCCGLLVWRAAASGMVAFVFPTMPGARIFARRTGCAALPYWTGFARRSMDRVRRSLLDRCLVCDLLFVSEFPSVLWLRSGRCSVDVLSCALPQPRRFSDRDPDHAYAWRGKLQHMLHGFVLWYIMKQSPYLPAALRIAMA
jgi:peptidoglycan/LPS O-acetylase OafA/YrhL